MTFFISGPREKVREKRKACLLNFSLGSAKMAIIVGSTDSVEVLVAGGINIGYGFNIQSGVGTVV